MLSLFTHLLLTARGALAYVFVHMLVGVIVASYAEGRVMQLEAMRAGGA